MTWKSYPGKSARVGFAERLLEELQREPTVLSAGVATHVPFDGWSGKSAAQVEGHVAGLGESPHGVYSYGVGGDYFATLGFVLRAGRFLEAADSRRAGRVCVVDDDFARRYWPAGGALGQRLFWGGGSGADAEPFTIVGVVGAAKQAALSEAQAQGAATIRTATARAATTSSSSPARASRPRPSARRCSAWCAASTPRSP